MLKSTVEAGFVKVLCAITLALIVAVCGLGLWAVNLADKLESEQSAHSQLIGQVEQQKAQAATDLARLTAERDAKQLALDTAYKQQETQDALAIQEIDRLNRVIANQPIRVRYVATSTGSGACSGSAGSQTAGSADDSPGHATEAYGVLSARADQRFKHVAGEAEQINAAYASCRNSLMTCRPMVAGVEHGYH